MPNSLSLEACKQPNINKRQRHYITHDINNTYNEQWEIIQSMITYKYSIIHHMPV